MGQGRATRSATSVHESATSVTRCHLYGPRFFHPRRIFKLPAAIAFVGYFIVFQVAVLTAAVEGTVCSSAILAACAEQRGGTLVAEFSSRPPGTFSWVELATTD